MASRPISFTRRPRPSRAASSASARSIASQSRYVTGRIPRALSRSSKRGRDGSGTASASSVRAVSAASDLLVPMTPDGPRLSQPATYCRSATFPATCGTVIVRGSNRTPGSGTLR